MGYIEPNGVIQIFKGINLDNRYMHTIYFANETAQNTYFTSKLSNHGRQFDRQYYTKQNGGIIRLKVPCDEILEYTYMRFQNKKTNTPVSVVDPHSTKWFYAFITSINYVNESVTEITFEIDVMQTWFIPNGTIRTCMVLRNHVSDDTFGHNLEAEPIGSEVYDMDEIDCQAMRNDFEQGYEIVVQTSADPMNPPGGFAPKSDYVTAGIFNGLYSFKQVATSGGGLQAVDDLYDLLGGFDKNEQRADVISIIQFPMAFLGINEATGEDNHNKDYTINHPLSLGNYIPQNNKLYGYPFAYLLVSSMNGDTGTYRWEYFTEDILNPDPSINAIQFHLSANELGSGEISLYPDDYNGVRDNFDSKVVMDNFPKCAFVYDAYQAWVASGGKTKAEFEAYLARQRGTYALEQANVSGVVSVTGSVTRGVATAATFPVNNVGAVAGAGQALSNAVGAGLNTYLSREQIKLGVEEAEKKLDFTFRDARFQPNTVVGTQSPNIAVGTGKLRYRFFSVHVRKDELVRLDDFLTVFGYAINKVQEPKMNVGKYWTFLKTEGCIIDGNMPSSSKEAIARIIDGGIFFWKNGDNVGNFEVGGRTTGTSGGALINK